MNPPATATAASLVLVCFALICFACLLAKLQEFFVFGASACSTTSNHFFFFFWLYLYTYSQYANIKNQSMQP